MKSPSPRRPRPALPLRRPNTPPRRRTRGRPTYIVDDIVDFS